jgi:hypothetical protein
MPLIAAITLALIGCGGGGSAKSDTASPQLTAKSPNTDATDVAIDTGITATFNEAILAASVTTTSFQLQGPLTNPVLGTSVSVSENMVTLTPPTLEFATRYTVSLSTQITDLAGNPLTSAITWSFTTVADSTPPTVPTNLTVSANSHSELDLSWSTAGDNVGVTGYRIYRDNQLLDTVVNTTAADGGLTPATAYCYQISAIDTAGNESGKSTPVCASTTWRMETLNSVGSGFTLGSRIDVVVGQNDTLHASYQSANSRLAYAQRSGGSWGHDTVSQSDAVIGTSISVDSLDWAHIAYYEFGSNTLKYATNASGSWVTTTVDSGSADVGREPAIAIDTNDKLHIAYFDSTGGALKYATNASGGWVTTPLDSGGGNTGREPSIAIDSSDKVHIAYKDTTLAVLSLKYATNASGSWSTETVTSGIVSGDTFIAIGSLGTIHLGALDGELVHFSGSAGNWSSVDVIDTTGTGDIEIGMSLDVDGKIHLSYSDLGVTYATNISGAWIIKRVGAATTDGQFSALAIDSNGINILYSGCDGTCLKVATNY